MNIHLIAILHDMMKPYRYEIKEGRDTYYKHEDIDIDLANELKKDLALTNKEYKFLLYVVKNHHLFKMTDISNKKTIFNCAYSLKSNLEFFEKIKPILYGDFSNDEMSEEKKLEFDKKIYIIEKAIKRIESISKTYNWGILTNNILNKKNISKKIKKILKRHFVNGYISQKEIETILKSGFSDKEKKEYME